MQLQPSPTWYFFDADGAEPVRLLDDEGRADPALSGTPHGVLALTGRAYSRGRLPPHRNQLRHLELFVALQRWRR